MKTYQIKVQGRVQGVFYRASTKEKADELGLCGWVRNEADGSVYMELQGNETAVERMLNWCKIGPPAAKVDRVEVTEKDEEACAGFQVRR